MANSILDKVISSKHEEEITQFVPQEIVAKILLSLPSRERDILTRRFGLHGQPQATLEEIGGTMQVTRERIRQIERGAMKRIIENPKCVPFLTTIEHIIKEYLEQAGGLLSEDELLLRMIAGRNQSPEAHRILSFFLRYLCKDRFQYIPSDTHVREGWALHFFPLDESFKKIILLEQIFSEKRTPINFAELFKMYNEKNPQSTMSDVVLRSLLGVSNRIAQNIFDEWGLAEWVTIRPRRMKDKIYLLLKRHEKPLHFNDIARMVNEAHFDQRVAHPPTVHNELIKDGRFVLVGRGIYALAEHGYKPGTAREVIQRILKNSGPLKLDDLVQLVLKERLFKANTVMLNLQNKKLFQKLPDGRYHVNQV